MSNLFVHFYLIFGSYFIHFLLFTQFLGNIFMHTIYIICQKKDLKLNLKFISQLIIFTFYFTINIIVYIYK